MSRRADCGPNEARRRVAVGRSFMDTAAALADSPNPADRNVCASNAVLAAIAASDAVCCARLGTHSRGQDHSDATELLRTVSPNGQELARLLKAVMAVKDVAEYSSEFISTTRLTTTLRKAEQLLRAAETVVAAL